MHRWVSGGRRAGLTSSPGRGSFLATATDNRGLRQSRTSAGGLAITILNRRSLASPRDRPRRLRGHGGIDGHRQGSGHVGGAPTRRHRNGAVDCARTCRWQDGVRLDGEDGLAALVDGDASSFSGAADVGVCVGLRTAQMVADGCDCGKRSRDRWNGGRAREVTVVWRVVRNPVGLDGVRLIGVVDHDLSCCKARDSEAIC